ncbi:hypothetical protein Tco_0890264 [Tanacetum coccineum]|uniref:Uncharacterized protein n=1 Tax=Tanacetum coccineum TaxID=301880 RepID=A0ABQ5C2L7_9ASTR
MKEEFPGWFGTCLNDLEIAALHIDGQSIDVDAPLDIIDVVDEDDDIIDEEDPIPHDLADSDDEDLVNLDIDDGVNSDVARGHGLVLEKVKVSGVDRPLHTKYLPGNYCGVDWETGWEFWVKGTRKTQFMDRQEARAGNINYCLGDPEPRTQFVTTVPTWNPYRWPLNPYARHPEHLQKIYNGKKATLKERYWIPDSDETYDLERIKQSRPSHIFEVNWDAQIAFWNDPKNRAGLAQNKQHAAITNSNVVCDRDPGLLLLL